MSHRIWAATVIVMVCAGFAGAQEAEPEPGAAFVAGTAPSARPPEAPVIEAVEKDADWYAQALTGVSQPYPASLSFLEEQGNWFSPFLHPGMPPPYDIRGWYQTD